MNDSIALGAWIRSNFPYPSRPITHLKLQKLAFYCYGAALAFGYEDEVGSHVTFEAWDHGPVNRELWRQFREHRAEPLPTYRGPNIQYSRALTAVLRDVLVIYGPMTAWQLRQESHLEGPWINHKDDHGVIGNDELWNHFYEKFNRPPIYYPEHLMSRSSFALDRIPVIGFPSLRDLARSISKLFLK